MRGNQVLLLVSKMEQGEQLNREGCAGQRVSRENEGIQEQISNHSQEAWPGIAGQRAERNWQEKQAVQNSCLLWWCECTPVKGHMTTETRSSLSLLPDQAGTIKVVCEMLPPTGHVGVYLAGEAEG